MSVIWFTRINTAILYFRKAMRDDTTLFNHVAQMLNYDIETDDEDIEEEKQSRIMNQDRELAKDNVISTFPNGDDFAVSDSAAAAAATSTANAASTSINTSTVGRTPEKDRIQNSSIVMDMKKSCGSKTEKRKGGLELMIMETDAAPTSTHASSNVARARSPVSREKGQEKITHFFQKK